MKNCNVYKLYAEVEECATYQFDAYKKMDYWDDYLVHYFKGKSLPHDWKMPKYELGAPSKPLHDFVHGEGAAPFVSEHAKIVLQSVVGNSVQFWPIGKIKTENYYILNVTTVLDCLNIDASDINYASDVPDKVLGIGKAIFDCGKISQNVVIFKVMQYPRPIYVTDTFVQCIREHKLTGVGFEHPDNVGVAKAKDAFPDLPIRLFKNFRGHTT